MKLLLDQNLTYKIVERLLDLFPDSSHIRMENLMNASDIEIWQYAKDNGYTIVTQDVDFVEISIIKGIPPKIIWLRCGNATSENIYKLLVENYKTILKFEFEETTNCLQLF